MHSLKRRFADPFEDMKPLDRNTFAEERFDEFGRGSIRRR